MPFDDKKFFATATKADVAGVALRASIVLMNVGWALEKLAGGDTDIKKELDTINKGQQELHEMFDSLTGYTKE